MRGFEPQEQPIVLKPVISMNDFGVDTSELLTASRKKGLLKPQKSLKEQALRDLEIKNSEKTTRLKWKDLHGGGVSCFLEMDKEISGA